jgi:uncharacterized delta-60 repeat protein
LFNKEEETLSKGAEMRRLILMIALLSLSVAAAQAQAKGPAGNLDLSFGQRGKVVKAVDLEPETWASTSASIARLSRNVNVVLVNKTLLAFRSDGRLAAGFGGGRVEVASPGPGAIRLSGITATPDGGLLVAGSYRPAPTVPLGQAGEWAFVPRYLSDGSLDTGFGNGGSVVTSLGFAPPTEPFRIWSAPIVNLEGIAVDGEGRIVLGGSRIRSLGGCRGGYSSFREGFGARLLANGAPDPGFAEGGIAPLPEAEAVDQPLITQSDGVYLSARSLTACFPPPERLLIRLGSNGWRVSGFAAAGILQLSELEWDGPRSTALDSKGRILLLSSTGTSTGMGALVRRVLPNGRLDPGFGAKGSATLASDYGNFSATAITVDHAGRILVAGSTSTGSFVVARLTARGDLDRRFGGDGTVQTRFGRRSVARATSIKLMPNGRILVAGPLSRPSLGGGEGLALAAYLSR